MNSMFSYLILILVLIRQQTLACSPIENWVPSSIDDQVEAAGIIIDAIVTNREEFYAEEIQITINYVYKACAPQNVTVIGFRSSAACGIDAPLVGERIFIFGNKTINKEIIALNEINIHTGMVNWDEEIQKNIDKNYNKSNPIGCDPQAIGGRKNHHFILSHLLFGFMAYFIL